MRVLVAGGTGVIGAELVPLLAAGGHEVTVMARGSRRHRDDIGARFVAADALDAPQVRAAFDAARPEAVVDLLTAIPDAIDPRHIARDFAATNRLRTTGTANLIAAARASGVSLIVGESIAFAYDPAADAVSDEDAPLWGEPPKAFRPVMDALREHERLLVDAGASVLRFGQLYGPGTTYAADGSIARQVRQRNLPIAGGGTAIFSFVHVRDAARAVAAALALPAPAVVNVVDDDPAPLHEWLPVYARLLGAKPPRRAPRWIVRLIVGGYGVAFMTALRGASNARAKELLRWEPVYRSWRDGFAAELQ